MKEVYWMQAYTVCHYREDALNMTAVDRASYADEEVLIFIRIDFELNEEECIFDTKHLACMNYIVNTISNGKSDKIRIAENNIMPIKNAFMKKRGDCE